MNVLPFAIKEPFLAYFCGNPRSGKSYLASYVMYYVLNNMENSIYTDLQGINPDNKRLYNFDKTDFLALWNEEMQANNNAVYGSKHDEIFRKKFKEKGYLNSFIVIDEVQEFLDQEVKVWKRIFSYYGHYDMKIILITQDLGLVHKRYKTTPDKFIWAVSSGNRIGSKDFLYRWFNNHQMRNGNYFDDLVSDFKIPKKKEVFGFYNSGSIVAKKSNLPKVLKTAIMPAFLMVFMGFVLYYLIAPTDEEINKSLAHTKQPITTQKSSTIIPNRRFPSEVQNSLSFETDLLYLKYTLIKDEIIDVYLPSCPNSKLPLSFFIDNNFKFYQSSSSILFIVPTNISNSIKGLCNEKNTNTNTSNTSMFNK